MRLKDANGSTSVECIVTFPLLSLWLMGSFVWFDAYRSNSQTAKVAYTIADISARYIEVDDTDFAEIFAIHKTLLPNRVQEGWLRISSICWNGTEPKVVWSYLGDDTFEAADMAYRADPANNDPPRLSPMRDADIPLNLIPPMAVDDSIILTEVFGRWVPIADWVGVNETVWGNKLVTRPRFVSMIPYKGTELNNYPDRSSSLCPASTP